MLQSAFSNQLISLSQRRSFIKFSQSVDLSVTIKSLVKHSQGCKYFSGSIFILSRLRAVFIQVCNSILKTKKTAEVNFHLYKMG